MIYEIRLEKLSGHETKATIGRIMIKVDDEVKLNDTIFNVETKKGNVSIKSERSGTIKGINVQEGDSVSKGDVLATIESAEETKEKETATKKPEDTGKKKQPSYSYMSGMLGTKKEEISADVTIVGGGPGGYVAAIYAAKSGLDVILIEKESLGGTCLNWGCIPTKALIKSGELFRHIKNSVSFGISCNEVTLDIKKVINRKNNIVQKLVGGIEFLFEKNGVKYIKGTAEIPEIGTVRVESGRIETTIKTKNIIIATGSDTSIPQIQGINNKRVMTSREALDIKEIPQRLVVIGGGIIGMEFAGIFSSFGSHVTVIEYAKSILPDVDRDISSKLAAHSKKSNISIHASSEVKEILDTENGDVVVVFSTGDKKRYVSCDSIITAVGREPVFGGIEIEKHGIEKNGRGIKVDGHMRTNVPGVYAIGDVTDIIHLAHVASHQGIVAIDNILGRDHEMDYSAVPGAIFTSPEIAVVGIGEMKAIEKGLSIETGIFPFSANGKALILGEPDGFVKIIKDKSSEKIIGAGIIGPAATDLIAELTLAVQNNLSVRQIIDTIHAHPTIAESIHEAAMAAEGGAIHFA